MVFRKQVTMELRELSPPGLLVMRSTAEVEQPPTAYLFTGQGSAVVGMGMDLYATSGPNGAARLVWGWLDSSSSFSLFSSYFLFFGLRSAHREYHRGCP